MTDELDGSSGGEDDDKDDLVSFFEGFIVSSSSLYPIYDGTDEKNNYESGRKSGMTDGIEGSSTRFSYYDGRNEDNNNDVNSDECFSTLVLPRGTTDTTQEKNSMLLCVTLENLMWPDTADCDRDSRTIPSGNQTNTLLCPPLEEEEVDEDRPTEGAIPRRSSFYRSFLTSSSLDDGSCRRTSQDVSDTSRSFGSTCSNQSVNRVDDENVNVSGSRFDDPKEEGNRSPSSSIQVNSLYPSPVVESLDNENDSNGEGNDDDTTTLSATELKHQSSFYRSLLESVANLEGNDATIIDPAESELADNSQNDDWESNNSKIDIKENIRHDNRESRIIRKRETFSNDTNLMIVQEGPSFSIEQQQISTAQVEKKLMMLMDIQGEMGCNDDVVVETPESNEKCSLDTTSQERNNSEFKPTDDFSYSELYQAQLNYLNEQTALPPPVTEETRRKSSSLTPQIPTSTFGTTTTTTGHEEETTTMNRHHHVETISGDKKVCIQSYAKTWEAIANGEAHIIKCLGCGKRMQADKKAKLVFCPYCRTVSPAMTDDDDKNEEENDTTIESTNERKRLEDDIHLSQTIQKQEYVAAMKRREKNGGGFDDTLLLPSAEMIDLWLKNNLELEMSQYHSKRTT